MRILLSFKLVAIVCLASFSLSGCATKQIYSSLDLASLPCENIDRPFFSPVEFDEAGNVRYPQQVDELHKRFADRDVTDVLVFVHGWNKNSTSAESDYQSFLCRLHARLYKIERFRSAKRAGGLVVVGVFWPSTITNRAAEPLLLMPYSYFQIRNRADQVAEAGLAKMLANLTPLIDVKMGMPEPRVHLIGHSFGGRMVVKALETMHKNGQLVPFFSRTVSSNVILLNAAVPSDRFDWIVSVAKNAQGPRFSSANEKEGAFLYNIYSGDDAANKYLFPIASLFNDDQAECAVGACGARKFLTMCVATSGQLETKSLPVLSDNQLGARLNVWNVDSTKIISSHSDIYKGRVASLIGDILYDQDARKRYPSLAVPVTSDLLCKTEGHEL